MVFDLKQIHCRMLYQPICRKAGNTVTEINAIAQNQIFSHLDKNILQKIKTVAQAGAGYDKVLAVQQAVDAGLQQRRSR